DRPGTLEGLDETVAFLERRSVRFRIDPIIEPIGFGFAASLGRYLEVRRRYPEAEMMMGVGNLTELTDVDSAGGDTGPSGLCEGRQHDPHRVLRGAGHPERPDHGRHQLGPIVGP